MPQTYVSSMTVQFVRSARCYRRRRSCDRDFAGRAGGRFWGNANQLTGVSPMLQESVPMARPTCVALFPWSSTSSMSPTITSGPRVGAPGLSVCCRGGITNDCGCPLASCVISAGCIAAPMEICSNGRTGIGRAAKSVGKLL